MKVNKVVGRLTGRAGTGNIFEVEQDGRLTLAMIWEDGRFHGISVKEVQDHIAAGKAVLTESASKYQSVLTDGSFTVENPAGWQRLYVAPEAEQPTPDQNDDAETEDELVFPISVAFTGSVKVKLGGISKLLKFIE